MSHGLKHTFTPFNQPLIEMNTKFRLLAISIGAIYLLFGGLKFFPAMSPAETIGIETIQMLTFYYLTPKLSIYALAILEIVIGLLLLCDKCRKIAIIVAISHLVLTFSPFILFPEEVFVFETNGISLLGQYIIKNVVLICALNTLYPMDEKPRELQTSNYSY